MSEHGSARSTWELIDELPEGMTEAERTLVERVTSLNWDELVKRAAKNDLVIVVDLRAGRSHVSTVPRKRAATASRTLQQRPKRLAGELWAAWLVASDDYACISLRMSVQLPQSRGDA